jgi:hypothetical protein
MTLIGIALTAIAVLILPGVALLWRGAVKWTRVEVKLDNVVADLGRIVEDKDRTHAEMIAQMREDRAATNQRLRWLEEHLWKIGTK